MKGGDLFAQLLNVAVTQFEFFAALFELLSSVLHLIVRGSIVEGEVGTLIG
jgi:hypothetical protein